MDPVKILVLGILVSWVLGGGAHEVKVGFPQCSFPAIFNFGDSNSDTGGFSSSLIYMGDPNGETYFGKPAGRVCDGRLIIDFIAEQLGVPYLSAYLDSIGTNFSHGANFAVSAATIRRQNDSHITPFYFGIQTTQYNQFKARTIDLYNQGKNTSRLPRPEDFSNALYTIDIGQNDVYRSMFGLPIAEVTDMIHQFAAGVQQLYDQGARTFWIHNMGPNGCLPNSQNINWNKTADNFDQYGCIKNWNERALEFNRQLKDKVIKLRAELPEAAITYVDVYAAKYGLISNAKNLGFTATPPKFCTKVAGAGLCANPSTYISWDGMHYTEAANLLIAKSILNGSFSDPPVPITRACHQEFPL